MKIVKQNDGSNKVVLDNGECFYIQKGNDPIDGLIDIGLMQHRTAAYIKNQQNPMEGYLKQETFFYALSRKYHKIACETLDLEEWYITAINEFNIEIKKQQKLRENKGIVSNVHPDSKTGNLGSIENGKYEVCLIDTLPELISKTFATSENHEDSDETHQYIKAFTLLRFIYSKVDIRKIEARISELKGYCAFLEKTAPDEFKAYCALADRICFDTGLEIDLYYEIFNSMKQVV